MCYCDRHGVDAVIGLARNKTLEKIAGPLMLQVKTQCEQTREKQRLFMGSNTPPAPGTASVGSSIKPGTTAKEPIHA